MKGLLLAGIVAALLPHQAARPCWAKDGEQATLPSAARAVTLPGATAVRKIRVGSATRDGNLVPLNSKSDVAMPPGSRSLMVSIGVQIAKGSTPPSVPVRFQISVEHGDGWQRLFGAEVIPDKDQVWKDYLVELPAKSSGKLRFETRSESEQSGVTPCWGSLLAIGASSRAAGAAPAATPAVGGEVDRPNIVLISIDTLAAGHLTSFGGPPGVSPNLDALLKESFSFRRAFVQYPNTLSSHASLFTGLYPIHHGRYGGSPFPAMRNPTVADVLAAAGYVTVAYTEDGYVSSDFGFDRGFDWYDNDQISFNEDFRGDAAGTFAKAAKWIERYGGEVPFFLFVHTYEVHAPYELRDAEALAVANRIDPSYDGPFQREYPGVRVSLNHNAHTRLIAPRDLRRMAALYAGEISYVDRIVPAFVRGVKALAGGRDTLVIVTADHGEEFGEHGKVEHGETLYNAALHVPLAFYWPGHIAPGESSSLVELVDVVPTILDLLGLREPGRGDGRSLVPAVLRRGELPSRPAYAELRSAWGVCRENGLPEDCRIDRYAVQTDEFKYVRSKVPAFERLYDLRADPGEEHDVAAKFPEQLHQARVLIDAYVGSAAASNTPAPTAAMDNATRERLRALGYLP